ncbi:MAG: endonuclease/exonuclease/phosphatase family protein [Planctomycetota bacterium]|nr:endonuclease/exonuclease/phosphatase family protein [Planctomycetota bacterium]MCX8040326.1 endonuclease/exonuclease/phosphatase family protein [Planctomycetota bacterium]MDW8373468.1 endonuclease/exonuclease/phosphatase family protein [Planctomycetota bacterium]
MSLQARIGRWLLVVLALLPVSGLALAALAPSGWWPAILAGHWAPQLALLALPAWCWLGRRWYSGAAFGALFAVALAPHVGAAYAAPAAPAAADGIVVSSVNLYARNPQRAAACARLEGDIVALIETLAPDREQLRSDPRWPHQHWELPRGHSGYALLSRFPLRARSLELAGAYGLEAELQLPGQAARLLLLHAHSPRSPQLAAANRQQLRLLAEYAARLSGPLIVLGDFNATAAAPGLAALRAVGLRAAAGPQPATWPSWLGPLGIGIDHILVRDLAAAGPRAWRLPGSDHRAVSVRLAALP